MDNIKALVSISKDMDVFANDVSLIGQDYEGKDEVLETLFAQAVFRIDCAIQGVEKIASYLSEQNRKD